VNILEAAGFIPTDPELDVVLVILSIEHGSQPPGWGLSTPR
jgi:hypothetical protein